MDRKEHEPTFSQQCLFSSSEDPKDTLKNQPSLECFEVQLTQGFTYIHNWVANAALRTITKNQQSEIVLSMIPFKTDKIAVN